MVLEIGLTSLIIFIVTNVFSDYEQQTKGDVSYLTALIGVSSAISMVICALILIWS